MWRKEQAVLDLVVKLLGGVGLAIACGLNPFLPLLVLSVGGVGKRISLNPPFDFLASWGAVISLAVLVGLDVFADKLPGIQKLYTQVNYLVRPLAGAIAFAAVVPASQLETIVSLVLGAVVAEGTYLLKSALRPAVVNSSKTASLFAPLISIGEDGLSVILALLSLAVGLVGGPVAILVLVGMGWWLLNLRRKAMPRPGEADLVRGQ